MEFEFIIISIISGIFTLSGIMLLNHNWFKRQEVKYKYQLKKAKLSSKTKKLENPPQQEKTGISTITKFLPLLEKLDSDQLGDLIALLRGEGYDVDERGGIERILDIIPPELLKGFLKGLSGIKGKSDEGTPFQPQM